MPQKETLQRAIETILNDVIDRGFMHLMRYPQHDSSLNVIIRKASDNIHRLKRRLENHTSVTAAEQIAHYNSVSEDLQRTSLQLLGELQAIEKSDKQQHQTPKGAF